MAATSASLACSKLEALGFNDDTCTTARDAGERLPLPEETIPDRTEGEESEEFLVDFEGLDDRSNPVNWSRSYKWSVVVLLSAVNLIA